MFLSLFINYLSSRSFRLQFPSNSPVLRVRDNPSTEPAVRSSIKLPIVVIAWGLFSLAVWLLLPKNTSTSGKEKEGFKGLFAVRFFHHTLSDAPRSPTPSWWLCAVQPPLVLIITTFLRSSKASVLLPLIISRTSLALRHRACDRTALSLGAVCTETRTAHETADIPNAAHVACLKIFSPALASLPGTSHSISTHHGGNIYASSRPKAVF